MRGTPNGGGDTFKRMAAWNASQTPRTNDLQELLKHFQMNSPNGDSPETDYWVTPIYEDDGPGNACFGREACRQAYVYLLRHDDVAEAKRIAANYCIANFNECVADSKAFERGKLIESFIGALITGGRGGSAAAATGRRLRGIGCSRCFLAGTDVLLADGTTKDIEDVEVGDEVLATDPETGKTGPRQVTRLIITEDDKHFNELSIATADGIEKLTATHEHPFWSPSERDWIEASKLTAGMTLRTDTGDTVVVTGNRGFTMRARTYNLTVDDLHTYYVLAGETPVLVHNSGGCPDLDALSQSGMRPAKGKTTHAGREYQKHMNRGDLPVVPGKELKTAGQDLLDDILTNPQTTTSAVTSGNFAGGTRYIMPDPAGGRAIGATFDANGQFQYFGRY
ncbi:hypothetical protein SALBM217S_05235 [Streptomyces griseoloalbus]